MDPPLRNDQGRFYLRFMPLTEDQPVQLGCLYQCHLVALPHVYMRRLCLLASLHVVKDGSFAVYLYWEQAPLQVQLPLAI